MSSNESRTAEPSGGGKGIFIALIPWIVFTVLASHATLKIGSLAALATAIVIAGRGVRAGRPRLLELGAVVTFSDYNRPVRPVAPSKAIDLDTASPPSG